MMGRERFCSGRHRAGGNRLGSGLPIAGGTRPGGRVSIRTTGSFSFFFIVIFLPIGPDGRERFYGTRSNTFSVMLFSWAPLRKVNVMVRAEVTS
jgi:hypothetical protein